MAALNDPGRLSALRETALLDSLPEDVFDRLIRIGEHALRAPVVLITLVDDRRQFFKASAGLPEPWAHLRETPLDRSLCTLVIASGNPVILDDAREDARARESLALPDLGVVAYAGAPVLAPGGEVIGSFAAIDRQPRAWTPGEVATIRDLAAATSSEIAWRIGSRGRERAEAELGEREAYFRSLVENTMDVIHVLNPDGTTRYITPSVQRLLGFDPDALIGRSAAELVHPDDFEPLRRALREGGGDQAGPIEFRVPHREGGWRTFEGVVVNLLHDPVVRGVIVNSRDVTSRKVTERALLTAEAHYRRLVHTSPYGIFVLDAEGRFIEVNPPMAETLQQPPEEVLGRSFSEFIAPEHEEAARRSFRRTLAGELLRHPLLLRVVRPDGESRLVRVKASLIQEEGALVGAHGVMEDITEERAREERMRLMAAALENLEESVSILDGSGRMRFANASHARFFGYAPDTLSEHNVADFLHDREAVGRFDEAAELARSQGGWTGRIMVRTLAGQVIPVEMILAPVEDDAGSVLLLSIAHDVSAEIAREAHMRRAERLASLGTLLSGVAHELNNPLASIKSFAQLLLLDDRGEEDREGLEIIEREAARAARTVADLRLVAREPDRDGSDREPVDLNELVRHVLSVRAYTLETHNVQVREELAYRLPPVLGSRSELERAILNLVLNAEHSMTTAPGERRLGIRTRVSDGSVVIELTDSGPGIADEHLERIFDPFWTTKQPGEGAGLGLSLVHSIVAEHGGEISVRSAATRGAEFTLRFPGLGAPERPVVDSAADAKLRILVVDDEAPIRRSVALYLERRGHRVDEAVDGREALELLSEEEADYDVMLVDLRMPGLSGDRLLQLLRERGGRTPGVVILTGDVVSEDTARFLASAGAPVVLKPFDLDEVVAQVEREGRNR